jgi:hypothetical protein
MSLAFRNSLVRVPVAAVLVVSPLAGMSGMASAATVVPVVVTPVPLSALADRVIGSTVAPNGDKDPYSVTIVPAGYTGSPLSPGDVLVGDVSNSTGVNGRGDSIVRFHGAGVSLYSNHVTGPVAAAFNAAANQVWAAGYGNDDNGSHGTISVLRAHTPAGQPNSHGVIGESDGAWGIASNHSVSNPIVFWSDADGRIVRDRRLTAPYDHSTSTANIHFLLATLSHGPSPSFAAGTVLAPQGMVFDPATRTLYVADSASDQIVALHGADTTGSRLVPSVVLRGGPLHHPRGLALDPLTGHLLVSNGSVDNELVELTTAGAVVATRNLDPSGTAGGITGLATTRDAAGHTAVYYANINTDTLHLLVASGEPVSISGSPVVNARYGTVVTITGHAPAGSTVAVWFHHPRVAGYQQLRSVQADGNGVWSTSFKPNDDFRYYAQVGTTLSATVLEQLTPSVSGAATRVVKKGHTVVLSGHGAPHSSVLLHFHKAGTPASDFSLVRSVHVQANGVWSRPVVVSVDYRVYASRGALHPYSPRVLLLGS